MAAAAAAPRREKEMVVGRARVPGVVRRRFAMPRPELEEEEGLEHDAHAHEGDGVGDGPGLNDRRRVCRRSGLIARYPAGGPALGRRGPNLTEDDFYSRSWVPHVSHTDFFYPFLHVTMAASRECSLQ